MIFSADMLVSSLDMEQTLQNIEMYMTHDSSPKFQETYAFLDRRLGDVGAIGKGIVQVRTGLDFVFKTATGILESVS